MSGQPWDNETGPDQERLAAFLDGERDPDSARAVAAWLGEHPEVAAELEDLHDLQRLFQAAPPAEPSAAQWAESADRIDAGLADRPRSRRRLLWGLTGL